MTDVYAALEQVVAFGLFGKTANTASRRSYVAFSLCATLLALLGKLFQNCDQAGGYVRARVFFFPSISRVH